MFRPPPAPHLQGPAGADPPVIRVVRPADGSLVGELAVTPPADVARRVERCRSVQGGWATLPPRDRVRRLTGLLEAMEGREKEIEETVVAETGKPPTEALLEIATVLDHLRFLLKNAGGFMEPRRVSPGWLFWKKGLVVREPLGVVGVVSPWNYPFILTAIPTLTALFAGNGVVLKPSELTPYSGLLVEDLVRDAGLPDGLVQVVVGGEATGDALVRSGVDKVAFTGSSETGRKIMAAAAETLTPVLLELGGKDPAIVLADADLARAARGIVWGAFQNAGQTCIGVERVYVEEAVYDAFLRAVLARVKELAAGSTAGVDLGPLITPEQLQVVEDHVREALERGATVAAGGDRTDPASNVHEPTVLTHLHREAVVLREETFGPVLPVVSVKDAEEAVAEANRSAYGLSASVWTGDRARGVELARRLDVGGVCVNDVLTHYAVPGLPFGGVKDSGFGRSGGVEGLAELTRSRSILVDRARRAREPWWFPYSRGTERLLRSVLVFRRKGGVRGFVAGIVSFLRRRWG